MKRIQSLLLIFALAISSQINAEAIARVMKSQGDVMVKSLGKASFSTEVKPGHGINLLLRSVKIPNSSSSILPAHVLLTLNREPYSIMFLPSGTKHSLLKLPYQLHLLKERNLL